MFVWGDLIPSFVLPKRLSPAIHTFLLLTGVSSFMGLQWLLSWKDPVANIAAYPAGRVLSFTNQVSDGVCSWTAASYSILGVNNEATKLRHFPPQFGQLAQHLLEQGMTKLWQHRDTLDCAQPIPKGPVQEGRWQAPPWAQEHGGNWQQDHRKGQAERDHSGSTAPTSLLKESF